jgi:hypothetical protein
LLGDKGSRVRASAPSVVKVIVNCGRITNDGLASMQNKRQHFRRVENGDWGLEIEMKREETERAEILKMEKVGEWKIGTLHSCLGKNVHGITMYCTGEASRVTSKATAGARR